MHTWALGVLAFSVVSAVGASLEDGRRSHPKRLHHHFRRHSDLTRRDGDGRLYTICMVQDDDGSVQSERCYAESPHEDQDVACFVAWSDSFGVLRQGCHRAQDVSLDHDCSRERCMSNQTRMGVHFCCCYGVECNKSFTTIEQQNSLETNNV